MTKHISTVRIVQWRLLCVHSTLSWAIKQCFWTSYECFVSNFLPGQCDVQRQCGEQRGRNLVHAVSSSSYLFNVECQNNVYLAPLQIGIVYAQLSDNQVVVYKFCGCQQPHKFTIQHRKYNIELN